MRFLYLAKPSMLRDTGGKAGRLKLSHRFNSGGQAALVTRSGVLMQGTLAAHCINQTLSLLKRFRSNGFIASEDGLADSLDSSTIARTLRRKVLVASNGLTGTFASLFSISHLGIPKKECLLDKHTVSFHPGCALAFASLGLGRYMFTMSPIETKEGESFRP